MRELYATLDLGSNSFHMLTAALEHDEIRILDSISEKVMLADGLTKEHGISEEAQKRGLDCAARFAQRMESIPKENIRIVGTNTLRAARNADDYVTKLEKIFGASSIDIISGIEEARLIYLGVNHSWSSINKDTKNLVADIGGGSTEFITGKNFTLKNADSLRMGCVAYRRYFPGDEISESNFRKAVRAAKLEISNIKKDFPKKSWENAIGSAGTFKAIEKILVAEQITEEGITLHGLKELKRRVLLFSNFAELELQGLKPLRERTIVPGLAITWAIFQSLKIKKMHISRGGLREGVLYDLIGRHKAEDIRQRSIQALSKRHHVPEFRVKLFQRISKKLLGSMTLNNVQLTESDLRYLDWAVQSCRIGLSINHSQYQNHSAYLIKHSELSGFTIKERKILSTLVKCHRRKINTSCIDELGFNNSETQRFLALVLLLRVTAIIGQNGKMNNCGHLKIKLKLNEFEIILDKAWFKKHPLIRRAISVEESYWEKAELSLKITQK